MTDMTQAAWEKPASSSASNSHNQAARRALIRAGGRSKRWQYLLGGLLILGAVGYLLISGTLTGARFFVTVEDVLGDAQYVGQQVRVTGAVIGDTIVYDAETLLITFSVAHIPHESADLAETLHLAANNPAATQMAVRIENEVMPETLRHEAQAIMTGTLGEDGIFHVSDLFLKCPSRFSEGEPDQSIAQPSV